MNEAKLLEKEFGISAERIAEIDEKACEGVLEGTPVTPNKDGDIGRYENLIEHKCFT